MRKSFVRDQRGTVAIIFGLALIPLLAFMGAALDYTRASAARTSLQAAIDSTALAMAHEPVTLSDDDFQTVARNLFNRNYTNDQGSALDNFTATRDGSVVTVSAQGHLPTSLLGVVGVKMVDFAAQGTVQSGSKNLEVVMALDNSGSMAQSGKIQALRTAAGQLVDTLSSKVTKAGQLKIGLVPFATDVRVDPTDTTYTQANWIDFTNATQQTCKTTGSGKNKKTTCTSSISWTGCIEDRSQPNNTTDVAVTGTSTMYPAYSACGSGENLTYVQPLSEDFPTLKTQIQSMTAGGNTNITIGAIWGLSLLSPTAPFTEGADYSDTNTHKILILLTDGENTSDRFSSCGNSQSCINTMNTRTLAACTAAKNAGVEVFTIGVMTTNAALLTSCATDANHYSPVTSSDQLSATFIGIANTIASLRLTS